MDRLAQLSADLTILLRELREEAVKRDMPQLTAPLAWLDEANGWLRYELVRSCCQERDPVPFTYIPVEMRR
jgi:hypothetical protein